VVETSCYIMANCLAHLRPLVSRYAPSTFKEVFEKAVDQASGRRSAIGGRVSAPPPVAVNPAPTPVASRVDPNVDTESSVSSRPSATRMTNLGGLNRLSLAATELAGLFQGTILDCQPYTHEIEGRRNSCRDQDPTCIRVTTEVDLRSEGGKQGGKGKGFY
jgi:hypothetical protein